MDHAEGFLNLVRDAKQRVKEEDVQPPRKNSMPEKKSF